MGRKRLRSKQETGRGSSDQAKITGTSPGSLDRRHGYVKHVTVGRMPRGRVRPLARQALRRGVIQGVVQHNSGSWPITLGGSCCNYIEIIG